MIIFLLFLILLALEGFRYSRPMDTQDVNVISNNVDYQKLLKDYESLLTERQIELDKLQGINSILENKIKVLLTK